MLSKFAFEVPVARIAKNWSAMKSRSATTIALIFDPWGCGRMWVASTCSFSSGTCAKDVLTTGPSGVGRTNWK